MKPGQMAMARMPLEPYSTAAALVSAMAPALAAEYTLTGKGVAFIPPVDDQLRMTPPPVGSIALMPCLVPSMTLLKSASMMPVVLVHGDLGQLSRTADAGHVQDGVDASEGVKGCREHRFDLILLGDIALKWHDRLAKFGGRLLLATTDVGGEYSSTLAVRKLSSTPSPYRTLRR